MLEALMGARAGRGGGGGGRAWEGGSTLQKSSCDSQTWLLLLHGRDGPTRAAEENRTDAALDGAAFTVGSASTFGTSLAKVSE